jgi:sugar phosphate isomerase/epimerase
MSSPIALQLYTVRDLLRQNPTATLTRIAEIGYAGIEASLLDPSGEPATALLAHRLGLQVPSVMTGSLPFDNASLAALDTVAALGCRYVGLSWYPPDALQSAEDVKKLAATLNQAADQARQHGLELFYHNHWFEFEPRIEGRTAWEILFEQTDPAVRFEIDVYWAQTGGSDPIRFVRQGQGRVPLLHIKDGPAVFGQPMVAVGEGSVDIPGVVAAGAENTQWLIIELDECATDMQEAVAKSYRYLVEKGLGHGTKS